jgi:tetratricopeptide (TPR) repeat protein
MSGTWIFLWLLAWATGTPLGWIVLVFALWWVADRFTFRLFPSPMPAWRRWRRKGVLRRTLSANPHDRRARFELADLLLARHPREAVEVLRPNLEAGDDDVHTAFLMGAALARSGFAEQAERVLAAARGADPDFRLGEIDLELGRLRVRKGDHAGAREALERLLVARPGTVEGRWLLALALDGLGEAAAARRVRAEGWREYAHMPRFHRRQDRLFAWRLRPWRPAAVAIGLLLVAGAALRVFL